MSRAITIIISADAWQRLDQWADARGYTIPEAAEALVLGLRSQDADQDHVLATQDELIAVCRQTVTMLRATEPAWAPTWAASILDHLRDRVARAVMAACRPCGGD